MRQQTRVELLLIGDGVYNVLTDADQYPSLDMLRFAQADDGVYLSFETYAEDLALEALLWASAVNVCFPDVRVLCVRDELVSLWKIAQRCKTTPAQVHRWRNKPQMVKKTQNAHPEGVTDLSGLYSWIEVANWLHTHGRGAGIEKPLSLQQVAEIDDALSKIN